MIDSGKRKHILIITYNDYPVYEGLGVRIRNLSRVLREKGHRTTIFAPNIDRRQPALEELDGTRIIRCQIPFPAFLKKNRGLVRAWSLLVQTFATPFIYFKHLRKNPPQVVMAEQIYAVPPAIAARLFCRSKIIVDDIIAVSDFLRTSGHPRMARLFTWFERAMFRFCSVFLHTSSTTQAYYRERGVKNTLYVPNGVNCDEFMPRPGSHDKVRLLFNASTYSHQNKDAAVNFISVGRTLASLGLSNLEFKLVCWPAYNLPPEVREAITTEKNWLNFEEGVDDIAEEIGQATIALLPYSRGHHLTGGSRLKALEYLASGRPVIATPEGVEGISGLVPNEHFILAESIEEFPGLIADLLDDPVRMFATAQKVREFVMVNYDWRKTVTPLTDCL